MDYTTSQAFADPISSDLGEHVALRGFNPDVWFNNVETVAAEKIGTGTTTYVRNIYKYYVSYRLLKDAQTRRARVQQVNHCTEAAGRGGLP